MIRKTGLCTLILCTMFMHQKILYGYENIAKKIQQNKQSQQESPSVVEFAKEQVKTGIALAELFIGSIALAKSYDGLNNAYVTFKDTKKTQNENFYFLFETTMYSLFYLAGFNILHRAGRKLINKLPEPF